MRQSLFILVFQMMITVVSAQEIDLRGPIQSIQFKVNQTAEGIFATDFTYRPFSNSTMNSEWIWLDPEKYQDQQGAKAHWTGKIQASAAPVVKFKKIFNIDGDVDDADIKLSADVQYRLFVNGKLIERGPANIGSDYDDSRAPQHWFYDEFISKRAFKKGQNVIAIEVSALSKTVSSVTMGQGGLIMDAHIKLLSGKTIFLKTDTSWRCAPSQSYLADLSVDAAKESFEWITDSQYTKDWSKAVLLPQSTSSKWNLRQSELPQMMEKTIHPINVSLVRPIGDSVLSFPFNVGISTIPQKIRLTFNNLYVGYLGFSVKGSKGTRLNFVMREANNKSQEFNYTLADGGQTFEFPGLMDCKYIDLTITNVADNLKFNDISLNYSGYPVTYTGSFSCSDTTLNAIWKNIRWITQMNMQTYHMDSPLHQEPISDAGDYLIESMVNYYAFSSPLLIKQDLRKIALVMEKTDYKMFHTSYMLLWEQMLLNYYQYTGDKDLLRELSPNIYKLLDKFKNYVGDTGIITEAPDYMFMDWGTIAKVGLHHPPASLGEAYLTAFYYKALLDGANIADYLDNDTKAKALLADADRLKTAFNKNLYDAQNQLYKNGLPGITKVKPSRWLPKDTSVAAILPYANTLAVAYGLAPQASAKSIINYVINQQDLTISPYFMYFVFEALQSSGTFNLYGLEQLRRWKKLSQNPVGLKEGWAMGDNSHAWAGCANYELSARVLGISPAKPGYKQVLIKPNPGDLKWAKGTVLTPIGPVSVNWKNLADTMNINIYTPQNIPAKVILSLYKNTDITINGKSWMTANHIQYVKNVSGKKDNNDQITINTPGGNYNILVFKRGL